MKKGRQTVTGEVLSEVRYFSTPATYTQALLLKIDDMLTVPCEQSEIDPKTLDWSVRVGDVLTVEGKVRRHDDLYGYFKTRFPVVTGRRIVNHTTGREWRTRDALDRVPLMPISLALVQDAQYFLALQALNLDLFEQRNILIRIPGAGRGRKDLVTRSLEGINCVHLCIERVCHELAAAEGLSFEVPEGLVYDSIADYIVDITGWPRWSVEKAMRGRWSFPQELRPRRYKTVLDLLIQAGLQAVIWKHLPHNYADIENNSSLREAETPYSVRFMAPGLVELVQDVSFERVFFARTLSARVTSATEQLLDGKRQSGGLIAVDATDAQFSHAQDVLIPMRFGVGVMSTRRVSRKKHLPTLFPGYLASYWGFRF